MALQPELSGCVAVFGRVLAEKPASVEAVILHAVTGEKNPEDWKNNPKVVVFTNDPDVALQMDARGASGAAQLDAVLNEIAATGRLP